MNGLSQYLSPEPLLQNPTYVRRMAQSGMSVPTYAYAANNPLRFMDFDGLAIQVSWTINGRPVDPAPGTGPGTDFEARPGTVPSGTFSARGCVPDGNKFKFDALVKAVIDVYLNAQGASRSLNDGNVCSISEHEQKHVDDYIEDLKELDSRVKTEGFDSPQECQRAMKKFGETLQGYIDAAVDRTRTLRDPFDIAR